MRPAGYGPISSSTNIIFYDKRIIVPSKNTLGFDQLAHKLKSLSKGTPELERFQHALRTATTAVDSAWRKSMVSRITKDIDAAANELRDLIGIAALHDLLFDEQNNAGLTAQISDLGIAGQLLDFYARRFIEAHPDFVKRVAYASSFVTLYGDIVGIDKLEKAANSEHVRMMLTFALDAPLPGLFACGVESAMRAKQLPKHVSPVALPVIAARYLNGYVGAFSSGENIIYCHDPAKNYHELDSQQDKLAIIPTVRSNLHSPIIAENTDGIRLVIAMEDLYDRITSFKLEKAFPGVARDWPAWDKFAIYAFDPKRAPGVAAKYQKVLPKRIKDIIKLEPEMVEIQAAQREILLPPVIESDTKMPTARTYVSRRALYEPALRQLPRAYIGFRSARDEDGNLVPPIKALQRAIVFTEVSKRRLRRHSPR